MDDDYLYAHVKCGRKAWHLGDLFNDWFQLTMKRGDYVEHRVFRKERSKATADDRQLARDYAAPFTDDPE